MTDGNIIILVSDLFEGREFHDTVVAELALHFAKVRQDLQDSLMRADFEEAEAILDSMVTIPPESEAKHEDVFVEDKLPTVIMEDMLLPLREKAGYSKTHVSKIVGITLAGYAAIEQDAIDGVNRRYHHSTLRGLNALFAHYAKHKRVGVKEMYREALLSRGKREVVTA